MAADDLVTQGARASATMIFTMLNQINSVPAHQGLSISYFHTCKLHAIVNHIMILHILCINYDNIFKPNWYNFKDITPKMTTLLAMSHVSVKSHLSWLISLLSVLSVVILFFSAALSCVVGSITAQWPPGWTNLQKINAPPISNE